MNIITIAIIILTIATIYFLIKSLEKGDHGQVLGASVVLLVAVIGWAYFSSPNGNTFLSRGTSTSSASAAGTPNLEINDQIETVNFGNYVFMYVDVANIGTGVANNCALEIEQRTSNEESFTFLGYAYDTVPEFAYQTQTRFMILRSNPTNGDITTCIALKEIRDYMDTTNNPINFYTVPVGDEYLRLTAIATNGQSSSLEFELHVTQNKPPTLEIVPTVTQ